MVNRLSLVVDLNNIMFRALHTCKYAHPEVSSFSSEREQIIFAKKLMYDLTSLVKSFHPSIVFLAIDEKNPWRGDICENYKGTRPHDDSLDMKSIFKTTEEVVEILKKNGYEAIKVKNTEADDIAAMIKRKAIQDGDMSVVYVSSDGDWLQLASFDKNSRQFFGVFNPISDNRGIKKFHMTSDAIEWLTGPTNIFISETPIKMILKTAVESDPKIELRSIDPNNVLLSKIMCGDDGDNVPTFYDFLNKSGKKVRVTPKKMEKIFESCGNPMTIDELTARVEDGSLKRALCETFKIDTGELDYLVRLRRQRSFVELNPSLFPQSVQNGFDAIYSSIMASKTSYELNVDTQRMLAGTRFEENNVSRRGVGVATNLFKGLIDKPIIHFSI